MSYRGLKDGVKDWIKDLVKPLPVLVVIATVFLFFFDSGKGIEDKEVIFPTLSDVFGEADGYKLLSSPSDRRLVVVHARKEFDVDEDGNRSGGIKYTQSVCFDAFPDVGAAAEERSIGITPEGGNVDTKTGPTDTVGSYESVKLFRDATTALCQATLNGWISNKKDQRCINNFDDDTRFIIKLRSDNINVLYQMWQKDPKNSDAKRRYLYARKDLENLTTRRCSSYEILFTRLFHTILDVQAQKAKEKPEYGETE